MCVAFPLPAGLRPDEKIAWAGLVLTALIGSATLSAQAQPVPHVQERRTVTIDMDQLAFSTKRVTVTAGETVRFVLRNSSYIPHDFTIGTALMQRGRRAVISELTDAGLLEGKGDAAASLDAPNAVLIAPGETKEVVWTFTETQDLEFGCNVPGHYEFGMKGKFRIQPPSDPDVLRASSEPQSKLATWLSEPPPKPVLPQSDKLLDRSANDTKVDGFAEVRPLRRKAKVSPAVAPARPKKKPAVVRARTSAPVKRPKAERARGVSNRGWLVQVSAHRSATSARSDWIRLVRRHGAVLGSRTHFVVRADLGSRGIFYRLRVPGFASHAEARRLCASLKARGDGCFLIPPARAGSSVSGGDPDQRSADRSNTAPGPSRGAPRSAELR